MSLMNCKECGKEVSDQANKCPHCGAAALDAIGVPHPGARKAAGWLLILLGLAVMVFQCEVVSELGYDPNGTHSLLNPGLMGWSYLMIGGGIYLLVRKVKQR